MVNILKCEPFKYWTRQLADFYRTKKKKKKNQTEKSKADGIGPHLMILDQTVKLIKGEQMAIVKVWIDRQINN